MQGGGATPATPVLFLPGAGGSAGFWRPVAERMTPAGGEHHFLSWPGLGDEPHRPDIRCLDDLVELVLARLTRPADLVAQSMGGLVALRAALAAPERIRRLVLAATSGGIPVADLGASDWRAGYRRQFPRAASWITEVRADLSARLPTIGAPTLLLWGDADPVSPPAVGQRLLGLLPEARLQVLAGGGHDLATTHAAQVAALVSAHLR